MKYYIFSSGSKGNATLIKNNNTNILIDLGISKSSLINHLEKLNLEFKDINIILLTHDHHDHISGLTKSIETPIYGGINTYKCKNYHIINPYESFAINDLTILPIELSHDANDPLGFIITNNKEKLVYITDTGLISERNMKLAKDATYYIFESNHDKEMLLKTHRPIELKERIMSEFGHLSNEDSSMYLSCLVTNKTKEIILSHISMEANTYQLAVDVCKKTLIKNNIDISKIRIESAKQYEMIEGGYED